MAADTGEIDAAYIYRRFLFEDGDEAHKKEVATYIKKSADNNYNEAIFYH